jgi:tetratricopeptide (TPR) repeat protein
MADAALPAFARLHHLLGLAMEWCGWPQGAEQAFRDALRLSPGFRSAHYRLGEALARQGRWLEASRAFADAVRLQPGSAELQGNLVLALGRAGRWDAVAIGLKRLTVLRPREGEVFLLLGAVLKRLRRHDEAIRAFRWAVRLEPARSTKRFFLGEELLGSRGWQQVLASWGQALKLPAGLPTGPQAQKPWEEASPLHRHPGPPLEPEGPVPPGPSTSTFARLADRIEGWSDRIEPLREPFSEVLDREERERSILRVYREARPFPVNEGGRPATVYRSASAARERKRNGWPRRGQA